MKKEDKKIEEKETGWIEFFSFHIKKNWKITSFLVFTLFMVWGFSSSSPILDILFLFFALGIMAAGVALAVNGLRQAGLI